MPHLELTEFALPCAAPDCGRLVTIRSQHPREYIDNWLDSVLVVYCPAHRARG